jgi:hypothetical protein
VPVQNNCQIDETLLQPDIGQIGASGLVGPLDLELAQLQNRPPAMTAIRDCILSFIDAH